MSTWRGFTGLKGQIRHEDTHGIGVAVILGILFAVLCIAFVDKARASDKCPVEVKALQKEVSAKFPKAKFETFDGEVGVRLIGFMDAMLVDSQITADFPEADRIILADDNKGDAAVIFAKGDCATLMVPTDADGFHQVVKHIKDSVGDKKKEDDGSGDV